MKEARNGTRPTITAAFLDARQRHKMYLILGVVAAVTLAAGMTANGWDYYILSPAHRPFSPKHADLKPGGRIGLRLGFLGLAIFALVYLYPLRKHWQTLARIGKTMNWLDFHVMLGLIAPMVITFHCAFKMQGSAGMAYWTMLALTMSGIIGRYFYAQIPRSIGAAELSLKEMQSINLELMEVLGNQRFFASAKLKRFLELPDSAEVQSMPLLRAVARMAWLDLSRPFKVWSLRRMAMGFGATIFTLGGILRTKHLELEQVISMASRQAALSKRILFLSKTHRVFHLWHVVHRPFNFSFAIFVIIHVAIVIWLGYF